MVEFDGRSGPDDELEQELQTALRPLPAPDGFVNRVVARAQELPPRAGARFAFRRSGVHPALRWSIAAVLLLAVTVGGVFQHQRQRRIAGERAAQQVLLALRITSVTIRGVRNQIDENLPQPVDNKKETP